jgi:hypothetical protein
VFHFEKPYGRSQKNFKFGFTKKSFRKSESSYEKMSIDHIMVKTTDKYDSPSKTETDNSNIQSEKQTDELNEHKTYQSKIENLDAFTTTSEINKLVSYGVLKRINRSECASPMFTV